MGVSLSILSDLARTSYFSPDARAVASNANPCPKTPWSCASAGLYAAIFGSRQWFRGMVYGTAGFMCATSLWRITPDRPDSHN